MAALALLAIVVIGLSLSAGCVRDNGLPQDVVRLLDGRGAKVEVISANAPLSSRKGTLAVAADTQTRQQIVDGLQLAQIVPSDPRFSALGKDIGSAPAAVWGIAGRPAQLRLHDGSQLEYLYLLTTDDGRTYIVAEYSYG